MIALCGLAGVGKSVFGYTLALALGAGVPFLGRETKPCRVLYIDEENGHRDRRAYIYRAWVGLGRPDKNLLAENVSIHGYALSTTELPWDTHLRGLAEAGRPSLTMIDTATPACRIKDENSNGEAALAAQKIRGVMSIAGPDASSMVMKHLRVNPETGQVDMRGAKAWKGAVDAVWYHRRSQGRPRKDGLYRTYIQPEKVRAFGLQNELVIDAERIEEGNGLILHGTDKPLDEEDEK